MLVESVVETQVVQLIAAAGRSGVEEVYGVPYLDVGCDVWFDVCRVHHFSPLITAIRRRPYQRSLALSIPLPLEVDTPEPIGRSVAADVVAGLVAPPRCCAGM